MDERELRLELLKAQNWVQYLIMVSREALWQTDPKWREKLTEACSKAADYLSPAMPK